MYINIVFLVISVTFVCFIVVRRYRCPKCKKVFRLTYESPYVTERKSICGPIIYRHRYCRQCGLEQTQFSFWPYGKSGWQSGRFYTGF